MKKLIAILVSVVLLITSVLSVSMLSAFAADIDTTAVIPTIESSELETVENTANLPFKQLLKITGNDDCNVDFSDFSSGDGLVFYIENDTYADFFPAIYYLVTDEAAKYTAGTNSQNWYVLEKGDTAWEAITIHSKGYSAPVPKGFKGYVYLPISTSKILTKIGGGWGTVASGSVTWSSMGYGMWTNYGSAHTGGTALVSAPFAVSGLSDGLPSVEGVTIDGTYYSWFAESKGEEEETPEYSPVVMPVYEDSNGDPINLYHTMNYVPKSVASIAGVSVVKNTSEMPLTNLFSVVPQVNPSYAEDNTKDYAPSVDINTATDVPYDEANGVMVYVEVPENKTLTTDKFRFAFYISGYSIDAETGKKIKVDAYEYDASIIWVRESGDTEWKVADGKYYGVELSHGFKGYVYLPFASCVQVNTFTSDSYVNGIQINQLTTHADNVSDETVAKYGYASEEEPLIVSAPIFVTKDAATEHDTKPPYNKGVIVGETEYNYNKTVEAIGRASGITATETNDTYFSGYGTGSPTIGTKTAIGSLTPLTNGVSHTIADYTHDWEGGNSYWKESIVEQNFNKVQIRNTDGYLKTGMMFYVELPALKNYANQMYIYMEGYKSDEQSTTSVYFSKAAYTYFNFYYLPENGTQWVKSTDAESHGYGPSLNDANKEFKGYIYVPFNYFTPSGANALYYLDSVFLYMKNDDSLSGKTDDIKLSQIMLVDSFDTSSVLAYGANGLVNLSKNELCYVADYATPDAFYGDESLINGKLGATELKTVNMKEMKYYANVPGIGTANYSVHKVNSEATCEVSYVESIAPVVKAPSFNIKALTANAGIDINIADIDMTNISVDENGKPIGGLMVYVKNPGATPITFSDITMLIQPGSTTSSSGAVLVNSASLDCLEKNSKVWTSLKTEPGAAEGETTNDITLPAEFEGYIYLKYSSFASSFANNGINDNGKLFGIRFQTTMAQNDVLQISSPMNVANFTKAYPVAKVNGSTVAQNLHTGDFAVPQDQNGDLQIDLLDLVQAESKDTADNFKAFRESYLDEYFSLKSAEYQVLSANFSLNSLAAETVLADNPDRGYRTEFLLRIDETAESGDDDRTIYADQTKDEMKAKINDVFDIYFTNHEDSGNKTFLAYIYLTDYHLSELPEGALTGVEAFFEVCRERNVKSMLRFCYNWSYGIPKSITANQTKLASECANQATILKHIQQLKPYIATYSDTIHSISCGFIGYVGEMAKSYQWPEVDYATVIKAVVENFCVPNDLYFSVRSPEYKNEVESTYKYLNYISHNNDAFYGEQTRKGWESGCYQINHNGTSAEVNCYKSETNHTANTWWEQVTAEAAYTPQDGELFTNGALLWSITDDDYQKLSSTEKSKYVKVVKKDGTQVKNSSGKLLWYNPNNCAIVKGTEAILECANHRHTSLSNWHGYLEAIGTNSNYYLYNIMKNWQDPNHKEYAEVTVDWLNENNIPYDPAWFNTTSERNAYEFIRDHLGYRLVAKNASVDWNGFKDSKIAVSMDFNNYGFAAAFNMTSYLAIIDENGNVVQQIKAGDPSKWYNLPVAYYTEGYTGTKSTCANDDLLNHTISAEFDAITETGTYKIGFKLVNTAGDTAQLANSVEYKNGYNILGTFEITTK